MNRKTLYKKDYVLWYLLFSALIASLMVVIRVRSGIQDTDFYWHMTLGKDIWNQRGISKMDVYSWISPELGLKETAHSWAASVILYLFASIWEHPEYGLLLYVWITTFLYNMLVLSLWGKCRENVSENVRDNLEYAFLLTELTAVMGMVGRPQNCGFLLFAAALYIMQKSFREEKNRSFLFLPVISFLWANLHGGTLPLLFGFNFAYLILAFLPSFAYGRLKNPICEWKQKRIFRMLFVFISDVLCGILNPYGVKLFVYFCVTNNTVTKQFVSEWQRTNILDIIPFVCLLFIVAVLLLSNFVFSVEVAWPAAFCFFLMARYYRCVYYFIICMLPLIRQMVAYAYEHQFLKHHLPFKHGLKKKIVFGLCMLFLPMFIYINRNLDEFVHSRDNISNELIDQIHDLKIERLYTGYNIGGLLIYHGEQSFIDSRADLFPDDLLEDAIRFGAMSMKTPGDARRFLERYQFDGVLLEIESQAAAIEFMSEMSVWKCVYSDEFYQLFMQQKTI